MSWNGTCYCGYCGERGHNRRSCATRKADDDRTLEVAPDSREAKRILSQRRYDRENNKKSARYRSCTYCREPGHNRRGCPLKKGDKARLQERFTEYRKVFAEELQRSGIGPGALIRFPLDHGRNFHSSRHKFFTIVGLVTKVYWEEVSNKLQDVDLTHYRALEYGERGLAEIRVVSTDAIEGEDRWTIPTRHGEQVVVRSLLFAQTLPDAFATTVLADQRRDDNNLNDDKLMGRVEILSPAPSVTAPEGFFDAGPTEYVLRSYNIEPLRDGDKERLGLMHPLMEALYPENKEEMEKD